MAFKMDPWGAALVPLKDSMVLLLEAAFERPFPACVVLTIILYVLWTLIQRPSGLHPSKGDGVIVPDGEEGTLAHEREAQDHPQEVAAVAPYPGFLAFGNSPEPWTFENDTCSWSMLSMLRATYNQELDKSGNYLYGKYFLGKKRLWELRVQFKFKRRVRPDKVYLALELHKHVHLNRATKILMDMVVNLMRRAVGDQLYHSVGDDPNSTDGEAEKPIFAMPLWAFDQFILTPEGEEPPKLTDPALPSMGSARSGRVKDFRSELEALTLEPGPTYTFCLWGVSQWIDKLAWELLMPWGRIDCNKFCGSPPIHAVVYELTPSATGDKRHLQARKRYIMNAALWSSIKPPPEAALGELLGHDRGQGDAREMEADSFALQPRRHPRPGSRRSAFGCCGGR
jgi:hypothetical protein